MQASSVMRRHLCVLTTLAAIALGTACIHRPYRVYDSYYNDYHRWDDREADYYRQWTAETHRDATLDFRKLSHDDQEEYWKWRHQNTGEKKHKHEPN
jgi:hypothetical protein